MSSFTLSTTTNNNTYNNKQNINDVLNALSDIIKSQQDEGHEHDPTPTEYFALIMTTLSTNVETNHLPQMLIILDGVISQTSISILRNHYKQLSSILIKIAKSATEYPKILRLCLTALGSSMVLQDTSDGFWNALYSLQSLNALLAFIDDSRVKLRKTVHTKLIELMQIHKRKGSRSVRSYIAEFCESVLKVCTRSDYKRSLCIILFLENAGALLIEDQAVQVIIAALRVQSCNQPVLTAAMFRMIDNFFQSSSLSMNAEQTSICLKSMIGK